MDITRIAELLKPFLSDDGRPTRGGAISLSETQLQSISIYIDILLRWNSRVNLTAVRQPEEIVTRHFGESLFTARNLFPSLDNRVETGAPARPAGESPAGLGSHLVDLGSGAGFPGLPIKLWAPHLHLTLIESNQKKVAFLREAIRSLTLTHVDVFPGRAEDFQNQASVVTLRAVEHFDSILPTAARLVAPSGRLALLISQAQVARALALLPNFQWQAPAPIPLSSTRILLIGEMPSSTNQNS